MNKSNIVPVTGFKLEVNKNEDGKEIKLESIVLFNEQPNNKGVWVEVHIGRKAEVASTVIGTHVNTSMDDVEALRSLAMKYTMEYASEM